jgi:hypothetical protein
MRLATIGAASVALGAIAFASCRPATEISLVVSTDIACADLRSTSVTVGHLGEIEGKAPTTSSAFCDASGELGVLVVVPSGGKTDEVAFKLMAGLGRDVGSCAPPYGKGCVVARRAIRFVPRTELTIRVPLRAACDGVPCGETETCVSGTCMPAETRDPSACSGPGGCDEGTLGQGGADGGIDGAADGPIDTATYHDFADSSFWSTFETKTVNALASDFAGATFDGRYVHFAAAAITTGGGNVDVATRYDTLGPFTGNSSWSVFGLAAVDVSAQGFTGATFDGRFVYFVPDQVNSGLNGMMTRYDTRAAFATGGAWSTFDATSVNPGAKGFEGATFDGRFVYFIPFRNSLTGPLGGLVARYDTQASFSAGASWATFDTTTVDPGARGFRGAVFDGRFLYLAPYAGLVVRYDTHAPFAVGNSWNTFDLTTVDGKATDFDGAAFDGRFVYLVPSTGSVVARYDTTASFASGASWTTFDVSTVNGAAGTFWGAAFDGTK